MNPHNSPPHPLAETYWREIILALSVAVILFSIWCLTHGITTIFMHLYYFPIVLLAYRYRWKGFGLATLLAFTYLGLVIVFDAGNADVILGAFYRFWVFVGIAAIIAYLANRLVQVQSSLQQSAEITDRYLSLAPAIVLALDRNGAITYLNKKGGEILKCNPAEVVGKPWTDRFIPENERERVKQVISRMMDGQVALNRVFENPVLTSGGMEKSIRWSNTVLHDENGAITGLLSFGEDITEEKWQQDTLRELQQFQENVIANANVWISVLAPEGNLLVWNDAAEAISGYKKTEVLGKRTVWKQLYPDREYRKKVTGEIGQILGRDTFLENFETEIQCADATKKTIVWNTRALRDNAGTITGYIAIGRDVTAQKSAESRAGESSRFLAAMSDTLPLPVFFKDAEGKYLGCNPPFEKYIGITCDELIGKTAYDISPGDLADKYTAADRQVLDDPHPQNYETQVQYADGSRHDVIFYQAPFLNKDGSVGGLIGAFLDITERKRMEEALRESESFNRGLVENLPEYIAVYGQDGKILYVNPASAKALGYDAEVLVGTHVLTYIAEEHRDTAKANMATRQTQGNAPPYEIDMVTRDGLRRSVIVKATPIRYRNNPAILLLLIDITERKAAEEALNLSVERFKTVMDSIDALIYVTDMHTFKLLFINKYGRNIWGEIEGKVCWQTIQSGQKGPCPFCTNDRIVDAKGNPTGIYQWEFQNTVNGCWYDCRDSAIPWTDGRLVRMEIASDITRHKLIEISLRESEEKLNRILNDVQDVIWSLSWPDLNIYYISPSAEQVYGRTVQEFIKNPSLWAEVTHPDDRQISEKALEQLRNIGSAVRECRIVRPDGSIVWIHDKSHLIFDEHDTPIRLEGITSDITERKKAEEAIRSREEQFRVIFQTQQTGLIMVDATTHTITDANAAALNMIGASHDEVVGKICHTFICPAEMGKCPVTDLGQTVDSSERVLIRANGERIPILKSVNPVNIGGRPFLIESFIDLTERKRMEAEVTESRQLFADIISFLPDPTFVIDSQGKVLAWNRAIEELSGISAADMIGKGDHEYSLWMYGKRRPIIIDLVLHPDQDAARLDYTTIHWEGHTVTAQTEITLPGREQKISLSLVASPLLDAQEKVAGAIESIRDISSLREAEAALARLNANLEVIVQNRTRALEEEVAQRMHAEKDVQAALSYTRSVIEANPDLMVVLDRNGTILDINAAAEFLTGIPRDQLIGTPYFGYLVDDGTLYTAFSRLLESGMLENVIHIRHTDGHVTPLSVNATMIGGRDATDARIIVSAHDITRQKQDEEAIRSSRQMLTNVVENFPGVVFWKDKNSVYIGCNRNFSDGAGLKDPAEIIGKTDFDLPWAKTEAESYRSFDREVIEGGKSRLHIIETQLQSDGRIIWLDTNKIPLFGPDGTVIGILGTSNDITRQKQDEDSIKASLEEKVILLREVHHRVKNNLQIIISLVNLQMRQTDDPMVKQIMSETQNRVRAMSLVHEKLYRSESLSRIDFADYTRFLATQLFSFYGMDTRRVRLDFAMGGIMVDINTAVPLGLLMNELISNALKHAFPNGREGAISISGGYEEDLITLVVRDNGAGIPADFDWKNTTSLGMRLVTSLIDQVDGTIELDRTNGTVFTITVKRETADKGEG